jgi:hypothetical protein
VRPLVERRHGGRVPRRRWARVAAAAAVVLALVAASTSLGRRGVDGGLGRLLDDPDAAREFLTGPDALPVLRGDDGGRLPGAVAARLVLVAADGPDAEVVRSLGLILRRVGELGAVPDVVAQALATAAFGRWAALFDAELERPARYGFGPGLQEELIPFLDHDRALAITVVGMYRSVLDRLAEAARTLDGDELRRAAAPATGLFADLAGAVRLDTGGRNERLGRLIGATWWLRPAGARDGTRPADAVDEVLAGARGDGIEISGRLGDFLQAEVQYELEAALFNAGPVEDRREHAAEVLDYHSHVVVPAPGTPAREQFLRWRGVPSDLPGQAAFLDELSAIAAEAVSPLHPRFSSTLEPWGE